MTILLLLAGAIFFFYLKSRIDLLEVKIKKLEHGGSVAAAKPSAAVTTSQPASSLATQNQTPVQTQAKQPVTPHGLNPSIQSGPASGLEFQFGGRFFTVVGAVAVVLGVGFFFKFAIDQGLISESTRIVLGFLAGVVLLATGELLRKKYDIYSQVIQGTGISLFYLTIFSAYSFYGMFSQGTALLFLVAVSLFGVVLSLRSNSQHLGALTQVGAYLTPFLVGMVKDGPHELFIYLFIVNIAALLLVMFKGWRGITLGALVGTAIVFTSWYSFSYTISLWPTTMVYITLFFLTFLSANIYRYFVQKHVSDPNDLALVLFNPLFYFLASYAVLRDVNIEHAGWLAIILSVAYFVMGYLIPDDNKDAKTFHFGVCSILFLIGVPIVLNGQWITIAWASLGLVLLAYSLQKVLKNLEFLAQVVIMIAFLRFIIFDLLQSATGLFLFNTRTLTFVTVVALLLYGAYLVYRNSDAVNNTANNIANAKPTPALPTDKGMEVLVVQAQVLTLIWIWMEFTQFEIGYWIGVLWAASAALVFLLGSKTKSFEVRLLSYGTALLAVLKLIVYDSEINTHLYTSLVNIRFLAFVGTALFLALLLKLINKYKDAMQGDEFKNVSRSLFLAINLVLLWIISLEIITYFDVKISMAQKSAISGLINAKRVGISIAWSLYAGLLLVVGIALKSTSARLFSIALFALVIFKVFLYDTTSLPDFYRFVSFLSLGVVLLLTGFLYNRYKDRIEEFLKTP